MLLYFSAANDKSFREPFVFSMEPAPKQKGLDYSVFSEKAGKETVRGLCSSVIYGPNASGKTNIIGALDIHRKKLSLLEKRKMFLTELRKEGRDSSRV
ncbi:hypothetical protein [uncultured Duodenibacillus sp.]|uniref:hypothetical protein n=1 Tax=uncultured Duodenibacillus sp. TaxID=1980699 RepID=UPI002598632D|nr:hypothetical protein [uncultured Duodenibacillus sp.]